MKRISAAVVALAVANCAPPEEPDTGRSNGLPSLGSDQAKPQLALMDHLLGNYFASDVPNPPTICASVHDGRSEVALAPEDELALMTRYDSLAPFARCAWLDNGWTDSETGDPAMVFNIHSFTCASDSQCTGFGGYTAGQISSMSNLYTMTFADGGWSFTRDPRLLGERAGER